MTAPALAALRAGWAGFDGNVRLAPLGDGHINDTYLVTGAARPWVLQRLNLQVFKHPERLLANTQRVLAHLAGTSIPTAELVPTRDGAHAQVGVDGSWWRLWSYISRGHTLMALTGAQAQAAGRVFGRLQRSLVDLPGPPLLPTIDGFLRLTAYLEALDAARRSSTVSKALGQLLDFVDARRRLAEVLPPRSDYIHADCKIDNLLFSADGSEVVAVLDLDTVMLGHWAWDFGDLARSITTGADVLPLGLLCAAARGFVEGRGHPARLDTLLAAPRYVALMLGVRFLTDHLCGDVYFRVRAPGENLRRARQQFALVTELETNADALAAELARLPGVSA